MDGGQRPALPALTGLRIYAAIAVVGFHFLRPRLMRVSVLRELVSVGYVGVSLFFVLSGFILAYTYWRVDVQVNAKAFVWARVARIYPVYLVSLVVAYPFFIHRVPETEAHLLIAPVLGLFQAWVPGGACKWNCPGWTLSAEMFFYLLFPFLVHILGRMRPQARLRAAVGSWAASVAINICVSAFAPSDSGIAAYIEYLPLIRVPEFILGVVTCMAFLDGYRSNISASKLLGFMIAALLAVTYAPYLAVHNGLLGPLFAAVILAVAGERSGVARHLSTPTLVFAGQASYALYLMHVPMYDVLRQVFRRADIELDQSWGAFGVYLLVLAVTSVIVLTAVEEPARKWLRALGRGRSRRAEDSAAEPDTVA